MVHIPGLGDIPDEMNDAEFAAKVGGKACLKISDFLKLIGDDDDDAPNGTDQPPAAETPGEPATPNCRSVASDGSHLIQEFNEFFGGAGSISIVDGCLHVTIGQQTLLVSLPKIVGGQHPPMGL